MPDIYLDNAATTPLDSRVFEVMEPYLKQHFGNPSSTHRHGRTAKAAIETARKQVAQLLNVKTSEIYFTSGGTEANNIAIQGLATKPNTSAIITSKLEHHAVLHTAEFAAKKLNLPLHFVQHGSDGSLDLQHLAELLSKNTKAVVSLMHANNEIGNINPVKEIAEICRSRDAVFHSDTVQTMGCLAPSVADLSVDALSGSAHKFYGPKGIGVLYLQQNIGVEAILHGGSQERNLRAGTENVAGIVGLAKAMELAYANQKEYSAHLSNLKTYFIKELVKVIPDVSFNGLSGEMAASLTGTVSVSFPSTQANDMLLFTLDLKGISVSGGSACSSGALQGSHVLRALDASSERPAVRFSFGKQTTVEDLGYVIAELKAVFDKY